MAPTTPDLTSFRALSFDCYGTLIDWESGLASDLSPLLAHLPPSHAWHAHPLQAVQRFNDHSEHLWATQPTLSYDANRTSNLSCSFQLSRELDFYSHSSRHPNQEFPANSRQ